MPAASEPPSNAPKHSRARDAALVALTCAATGSVFVPRLGFYSDDWALLGFFHTAPRQALIALVCASYPVHFASRPVQAVYAAALYRTFGLAPLGYHAVNTTVLAACGVLLYLCLATLGRSRAASLAAALLFVTLPNYSTARFWFAVSAAPLSIALYLFSTYADLLAAVRRGASFVALRVAASVALVLGLLAYEVALPLFFLNPVLAWMRARAERSRASGDWRRALAFVAPNFALPVAIALYKARASHRLHVDGGLLNVVFDHARHAWDLSFRDGDYGLNVWAALRVNFVDHLAALPGTLAMLMARAPVSAALIVVGGALLAALVFWSLRHATSDEVISHERWGWVGAGGLIVFAGGYAIFLTNQAIQITPFGVGNRTAIAASLGVALVAVAVVGSVSARVARARTFFAAIIALLVALGAGVTWSIASFWGAAYAEERTIVADVEAHFPSLPPHGIVILTGVCRYAGPAVVFESSWDLQGALMLHYHRRDLMADVVGPSFLLEPTGVATFLYDEKYEYAYGPDLFLYDYRNKRTAVLLDRHSTEQALAESGFDPTSDCPPAKEGVGVRLPSASSD